MVVFEGKAFNEKQVLTITSGQDGTWSPSVKDRYYIKITFINNTIITWERYLPNTVVSKINELVSLINAREEAILKLTNT